MSRSTRSDALDNLLRATQREIGNGNWLRAHAYLKRALGHANVLQCPSRGKIMAALSRAANMVKRVQS